jgi:hypothetical protein
MSITQYKLSHYEHSEQARTPRTHELRDVSRCGLRVYRGVYFSEGPALRPS